MHIVNITVTSNGIIVDPELVKIPKNHFAVPIKWRIGTKGWHFTENGIEIKNNYRQFEQGVRYGESKKFRWVSRNSHKEKRRYYYTINLKKGKNRLSRDPGIQNGGHK